MSAFLGTLRKICLGIRARDTGFDRRGFRGGEAGMRGRLEQIGKAFAGGYNAALQDDEFEALLPRLKSFDLELHGFAFEGAAMGLALLDFITPWRKDRFRSFVQGAGDAHTYLVHAGAGWMLARTLTRTCAATFKSSSAVQRKVLTPNDFVSLSAVAQRLLSFQAHYEQVARPFEWKFRRANLQELIAQSKTPVALAA
jgi:hypothetical protein